MPTGWHDHKACQLAVYLLRLIEVDKTRAFGLSFLFTSRFGLWLLQEFVVNPLLIQAREIPYSEFRAKARAGGKGSTMEESEEPSSGRAID